ncbi:E3 ubiquitin-protein ligase DCST1 [Eleutherodactylus coqui]|uniref:E3 ubiquitin-protein ligase DCST1 n=1 Tax=Eleutherodactylus coqui TaxID=57060 RepID=UPI0034627C05
MPRRGEKRPKTTLKRICASCLPDICFRFLYSGDEEFKVSRLFLAVTFGSILGLGVYLLFIHPMVLHEAQKINLMFGLSGTFAFGWATSSYFRCSMLIAVLNILGKEGRTFVVILALAAVYAGPVANMGQNMEKIVATMSCNVELQINQTKLLWRGMTKPLRRIFKHLTGVSKEIKNRSSDTLSQFKEMEDQVKSTDGYSRMKEEEISSQQKIRSTQWKFELKTKLRCEYIIELGINKCKDWFAQKHEECMRIIWLPILNSLLCLPMKFTFLCNIMYLAEKWCKKRIPVAPNFGNHFDLLNKTVYDLGKDFTSTIVVKREKLSALSGVNISQLSITEEAMEAVRRKQVWVLRKMSYISIIMSCIFIFIFTSAFRYTIKYNTNIHHDNKYITTYFRQIDAHRRKLRKKYLLPLRNREKANVVFPFSLCLQKTETGTLMMELLQSIPCFILLILSICLDRLLIHIFQVIHKYVRDSSVSIIEHKLNIVVRGDTIISRLLQETIDAFNSTFRVDKLDDKKICLRNPTILSFTDYVNCCLPTVGLLSLCFLQAYAQRLHRVIASYFFPKREKIRVISLYNFCVRKRKLDLHQLHLEVMRKCKSRQLRERSFWGRFRKCCRWTRLVFPWRCIVCNAKKTRESHECRTPGCGTIYCHECWWEMQQFCWACVPYEEYVTENEYFAT